MHEYVYMSVYMYECIHAHMLCAYKCMYVSVKVDMHETVHVSIYI